MALTSKRTTNDWLQGVIVILERLNSAFSGGKKMECGAYFFHQNLFSKIIEAKIEKENAKVIASFKFMRSFAEVEHLFT